MCNDLEEDILDSKAKSREAPTTDEKFSELRKKRIYYRIRHSKEASEKAVKKKHLLFLLNIHLKTESV